LVTGVAKYNVPDFKPKITQEDGKVRLETGDLEISGIPNFDENIRNEWKLQLGDQPMNLLVNAGAYTGELDLGGLALHSLEVTDGASNMRLKFSQPNLVEMDTLRYMTGASNVQLKAWQRQLYFSDLSQRRRDYTLDFSGKLQRDAVVTIESGISHVWSSSRWARRPKYLSRAA